MVSRGWGQDSGERAFRGAEVLFGKSGDGGGDDYTVK